MAARKAGPLGVLIALLLFCLPASAGEDEYWRLYRTRYIDGGRVLDTGNKDVSHSEGQGWGMLLAEANGDRRTFDLGMNIVKAARRPVMRRVETVRVNIYAAAEGKRALRAAKNH